MTETLPLRQSSAITLPLALSPCFELFTPKGEMRWIAHWRPQFICPADGTTTEGMVFVTTHDDEITYWTLVDYWPDKHYARYSRVTPQSRSVFVEVQCSRLAERETEVTVTYTLVPLTEGGKEVCRQFVGDAFVAMINGWRDQILVHLAGQNGTLPLGGGGFDEETCPSQ
jgi:hypothetical protein